MSSKTNRMIGAILLVAGTTLGAAALALPSTTGLAGFFPGLAVMFGVWLLLMLTAFYLLEVNLRMKGESNIISMVHLTLGRPGEIFAWINYLLLLYALTAAYIVGCSQIANEALQHLFPQLQLPSMALPIGVTAIFGLIVYFGTAATDFLNRILMIGLGIAYVGLVILGLPHVDPSHFFHSDFRYLAPSLSVVVTSFGYHIIIPTLSTYLDHDAKALKWAIFIGSLIAFLVYVLWQVIGVGVIPLEGLRTANAKGDSVILILNSIVQSRFMILFATSFAFFAIVTSLIGVTLSLTDFLADGLKMKRTAIGRAVEVLLTFLPPLLFAIFYPKGFVMALKYAGIFVILLLAFLPPLMAYYERYGPQTKRTFLPVEFKVPGGKAAVVATILVSIAILIIEVVT